MEYEGLTPDDLANVHALNGAWLRLHQVHAKELPRLSNNQLKRLALAPFLLFSFREHDDFRWKSLLEAGSQNDLLEEQATAGSDLLGLQTTGLAFIWGLARRNGYVARLVSGAPLHWCEQIASATLVQILDSASRRLIIEPRLEMTSDSHKRLWLRGGSAVQKLRVYAQISALQAMLTSRQLVPFRRMPAAACRMPQPAHQITNEV
jgi:hypothetical protein